MTRHWRHARHARRVGFAVFLLVVGALILHAARSIAWQDVVAALRALDAATIAAALALTAASYLLYSCYDLAARRYADHHVATPRVMMIALIAYAFSLNIGALVGGTGFRFRMYAREGVALGRIARVVAFCIATNWIGYVALAGGLFASGAIVPPPEFALRGLSTGTGLRVLGVAMLCATVGYLIACRATHGRIFHVRGHHLRLPSVHLALLQVAMAAGNWALMAAIVARFLPRTGDAMVLAAVLLAAIATAIAHIPAGLGVAEAVFIGLLGHTTPTPELIAALLAYRACYYVAPLVLALIAYALLEFHGRPARSTPLR